MKRFFAFCCAILGMGTTMYGASADLSDYLGGNDGGDGGNSSSFTITTNADGSLTFSGSYTDTTVESNGSYSVSFDIAAVAGDGDTYTVTMSNFAISGSLSSAFTTLTAKITGITQVDLYLLNSTNAIYTQKGNGFGTKEWDLSEFIGYFDTYSYAVHLITVKITCTSDASIEMTVGENETITCAFAVDEETGISFSANGLENIFDTLTVEGDIKTVEAGETDVTENVVIYDNDQETESSTEGATPEAGWTLTNYTNVDWTSIPWNELEGYDAVKFVLYYESNEYVGWGAGGIYTFADGENPVYAFQVTYDIDEYIITVDGLKELCDINESGFVYNVWSPVVKIEVYFGVGEFTTGVYEGTSTAISNVNVEVVEVARYNLMGQKISGAERGINIIVYSDGSAKKVLIK